MLWPVRATERLNTKQVVHFREHSQTVKYVLVPFADIFGHCISENARSKLVAWLLLCKCKWQKYLTYLTQHADMPG